VELPPVVSRDEWTAARKELLVKEKEATRARDALTRERRRLPMVLVDKVYVFDGPAGEVTLHDMFEGRRQLIIYHFMFDPSWDEGCSSCSYHVDNFPSHLSHLHSRETTLAVVSRAPLDRITAFKSRMGWTFPWYSSFRSDFNYDFHTTLDESVAPIEYNYRAKSSVEAAGEQWWFFGEQPGVSAFLRDGETIFHTYSAYARGDELLSNTYNYLDLTVLGRQEEDGAHISSFLHHDKYGKETTAGGGCC
jgi:predicted dithiol-disulfide oxidoreductase (DUF899 family)